MLFPSNLHSVAREKPCGELPQLSGPPQCWGGMALCRVASCQCTHLSVRRMLSSLHETPETGMRGLVGFLFGWVFYIYFGLVWSCQGLINEWLSSLWYAVFRGDKEVKVFQQCSVTLRAAFDSWLCSSANRYFVSYWSINDCLFLVLIFFFVSFADVKCKIHTKLDFHIFCNVF